MEQIKIENTLDKYFQEAWELYESSFPLEERRQFDSQVKLFKNEKYNFDVLIKEGVFIGFLMWWEFDNLRFIEYFSTVQHIRNQGLGKRIIEKFIKRSQKRILLEVELPESDIQRRRINFYERLGFQLNAHYYEVPPMHEGFSALELRIMSFPNSISEKDVRNFIEHYHPIIFTD
jgi:GNAT superfamily N-acetyltransferase